MNIIFVVLYFHAYCCNIRCAIQLNETHLQLNWYKTKIPKQTRAHTTRILPKPWISQNYVRPTNEQKTKHLRPPHVIFGSRSVHNKCIQNNRYQIRLTLLLFLSNCSHTHPLSDLATLINRIPWQYFTLWRYWFVHNRKHRQQSVLRSFFAYVYAMQNQNIRFKLNDFRLTPAFSRPLCVKYIPKIQPHKNRTIQPTTNIRKHTHTHLMFAVYCPKQTNQKNQIPIDHVIVRSKMCYCCY